ncbi:16S rRNA (uracil(1498)-N(3))-methyltransferase [Acinetobacter sp. ANC 4558]|uniref:16S rRNA (uracil(1498)-N(3))-methyltransferase n=1 Tax=Acinetobacter sp. ANC 4558 TaxID=1977876 RepID=UPI000A3483E2|nr:16S rRNA (uracil(1498)-N(3))-methyltransferase [Acinetobacter sp. ANC 4558]OTG87496.1 16S rRNA (uracil(1498)-N(3))-methyltransferase [Acinetobacter sp. ANC 4558]
MPRFFIEAELNTNTTIQLTDTVFHHWIKVLRAQIGDQATLFNGIGGEYEVSLIDISKKSAAVQIHTYTPNNRTPKCKTLLGQVMSKGDRMDYAIQKAVELGVAEIQLLTSERCEMRLKYDRDQKKIDHWQAIAIAACEQCGMNIVPKILAPLSLDTWLQSELPNTKFVLAPYKEEINIIDTIHSSLSIALLIGPEGGLNENEVQAANRAGFLNWCIGERILRTETAPIVALSIINQYVK